jgi:two-component system, chemotaxis family, chemotaxis protein CheY
MIHPSAAVDGPTILVVDDNHHMRMLIMEILRAIGIRDAHEANDGAEALAEMRARRIDLVITDIAMQPIDGVDFVRLVRNSADSPNPTVPIIMITGHSTQSKVVEARDAGVNEFLAKPVTAKGVLDRIHRVIDRPRSFIRTEDYFGPDRRRRADPEYKGPMRRQGDPPVDEEAAAIQETLSARKADGR